MRSEHVRGARLTLSSALVASCVVLAGCGSGSNNSSTSSSPGSTTSSVSSGAPSSSSGAGNGTSSSSPSSAGSAAGPDTLTIEFSGDDIPQSDPIAAAKTHGTNGGYDFRPLMADAKPFTESADLSICQMEGALSPNNTNLTVGIRHHGPHEFAQAMSWMGYDGCSTANNHTFDAGVQGLADTRSVMAANGLKAAGPGPDANTPGQPAFYDVKGVKVAQLSYSFTLDNFAQGNDTSVPASAPWLKGAMWKDKRASGIIADAKAARAAGAQIVLVSMHWGIQFNFTPTPDMVSTATDVMNSGEVDTIIGNHAHVVQKCERINDKLVFFGLGNQISDQGVNWGFPDATQDGVMVKVTYKRGADGKWTQPSALFQPTRVARPAGYYVRLVTAASNKVSYDRTSGLIKGDSNSCNLSPAS